MQRKLVDSRERTRVGSGLATKPWSLSRQFWFAALFANFLSMGSQIVGRHGGPPPERLLAGDMLIM